MEFKKKQLSPSQIELTVSIPPEEMEQYMDQAVETISKDIKIQGFRNGKAPRKVVEQRVGQASVFQEATNIALPRTYAKIVIDEKIEALGNPDVKVQKAAYGNPFEYTAVVYIIPEYSLPDFSKISIKKKKVTADAKDIELALAEVQKQRATTKLVDRAAKKTDLVIVDFDVLQKGVSIENGKSKDHAVVIGEGKFIPGFEEKLIGKKKGDTDEFELTFPKEYHAEHLAGKKATFKVEIKEVKENILPKLDDGFAKEMGEFKDLKDFKKKLEENIIHEKQHKEDERVEEEMMKKIIDKIKIEIPDVLIVQEKQRLLEEFRQMVEGQGGDFSQYIESQNTTEEKLLEDFRERAVARVMAGLVMRKVAEEQKISVEATEVEKEIDVQAQQYAFNPEVVERIRSKEYHEYMEGILVNKKVIDFLKKTIIS